MERNKLDELLYHEELYLRQRGKTFWLTEGDTNSKFFHAATKKRKRLNRITQLVNNEGIVIDNEEDMSGMVVDYFKHIFTGHASEVVEEGVASGRVITEEQNSRLEADI